MKARTKENLFLGLGVALFITFMFTLAMCSGCHHNNIPVQPNPALLEESTPVEKDTLQCDNVIKILRIQMQKSAEKMELEDEKVLEATGSVTKFECMQKDVAFVTMRIFMKMIIEIPQGDGLVIKETHCFVMIIQGVAEYNRLDKTKVEVMPTAAVPNEITCP